MNRREFLPLLSIPFLPTVSVLAGEKKEEKALIFIWLGGGPASTETWDAKPDTVEASRPTTGVLKTNVEGMYVGGTFPKIATIADRLTFIHGVAHGDANHSSATHYNMTGYMTIPNDRSPSKEPCYGAIINKAFGPNSLKNGIPHYVKANSIEHDGSAWMGITNDGFLANEDGVRNLALNSTHEQFQRRMNFINTIEKTNSLEKNQLMNGWKDLRSQAGTVVLGSAADAFRIEKEKEEVKVKYGVGKSELGKNLLLARRLIQNGTKVVTVNHPGWDMHTNIKEAMERTGTELDIYLYTLLEDLRELGLSKKVMVVVSGEFGRTKLNPTGRDHNPQNLSVLIATDSKPMGRTIGATTKDCMSPLAKPVHPQDINATIFEHFNLPLDLTFIDSQKRPRHLIENGHSSLL